MALFGRKTPAPATAPEPPQPRLLPGRPEVAVRSIEEHRDFLLSHVEELSPFGVGALEAYGQTLCETIESDIDLPTYTSAEVDGFAVRGSDLVGATADRPKELPVVDTLDSPAYRGAPLTAGTCVRVAAGAALPDGADAVVAAAAVVAEDDRVWFVEEVTHLANVRLAGSDVAEGTTLLRAGTRLTAGAIGLLAEVGIDKVLVRPKPRVVVVTVGDSLVNPGLPITARGQHYDATTALVAATARGDDAKTFTVPVVSAEATRIRQVITDQLVRADLVVLVDSSAGVVEDALAELGDIDFADVAMHPGSRHGFALVEGTPVIVVPGGAAAAFASYAVFVRPLIRRLAGAPEAEPLPLPMPAREQFRGTLGVTELVPVHLGVRGAEPVGDVDRQRAVDLARADALAIIPPDAARIAAHADVDCLVLATGD